MTAVVVRDSLCVQSRDKSTLQHTELRSVSLFVDLWSATL